MKITLISLSDAEKVSAFFCKNSSHLNLWEPRREDGYHSVEAWRLRIKERAVEQSEGHAAHFIAVNPADNEIIATCSLTNIMRGPFQACNIGYAISEKYQGKGLMQEVCGHVVHVAFNELNLNRIMANYMPSNHRSGELLSRLGFSKEGVAKKYLKINGRWEDHVLTSLLNPKDI